MHVGNHKSKQHLYTREFAVKFKKLSEVHTKSTVDMLLSCIPTIFFSYSLIFISNIKIISYSLIFISNINIRESKNTRLNWWPSGISSIHSGCFDYQTLL